MVTSYHASTSHDIQIASSSIRLHWFLGFFFQNTVAIETSSFEYNDMSRQIVPRQISGKAAKFGRFTKYEKKKL